MQKSPLCLFNSEFNHWVSFSIIKARLPVKRIFDMFDKLVQIMNAYCYYIKSSVFGRCIKLSVFYPSPQHYCTSIRWFKFIYMYTYSYICHVYNWWDSESKFSEPKVVFIGFRIKRMKITHVYMSQELCITFWPNYPDWSY